MPERKTIERARKDKREGKAATTQAGEFVREEFHHVREGKHGAKSRKQAIAIGLSKARRAGVDPGAPKGGKGKKSATKAGGRKKATKRASTAKGGASTKRGTTRKAGRTAKARSTGRPSKAKASKAGRSKSKAGRSTKKTRASKAGRSAKTPRSRTRRTSSRSKS